jgi:hypothetical protein
MQWFMDEYHITRVAAVERYHVTSATALVFENLVLADWLLSEKIGPVPTLNSTDAPCRMDWFFSHGALVFKIDSPVIQRAYRRYHAKRLGIADPNKVRLKTVAVTFTYVDSYRKYMRQHFRLTTIFGGAPYTLNELIVDEQQSLGV